MRTLTESGSSGCVISPVSLPAERWIALVNKGSCKLAYVLSAPVLRNASAIVVYSRGDIHELQSRRLKCKSLHGFSSTGNKHLV